MTAFVEAGEVEGRGGRDTHRSNRSRRRGVKSLNLSDSGSEDRLSFSGSGSHGSSMSDDMYS